ncbi:MAG: sigma factor-like helix-turn-helix DNA-binding protein [Lawsonibacter sp.]
MARLPARQRTVLLLKYDRGLDNREIARVLDMTVSAVGAHRVPGQGPAAGGS